jgi:ArsR family transcriptional regulator
MRNTRGKKVSDRCESVCIRPETVRKVAQNFPDDESVTDLAETFKALGDPSRLKIVLALSRAELCVCEISEALGMTVSAVSHQLRLLRNLRLVKMRKDGRVVYYSLDDTHVEQLIRTGFMHVRHQ